MIPLEKLAHELDEAYYDNRVRHLNAIGELRNYVAGLSYWVDEVDKNFYQEATESRMAINALLAYVDVKGLGQ